MALSEIAKQSHVEVNEDGRETHHPGYREAPCSKCGFPVIVSKNYMSVPVCGDPKRDGKV